MAITASEVQELRKRTNVGMMDCKKALTEADGDMEKAIEILRTRGIAKAQDRAGRAAKEGVIEAYIHAGAKLGVLLEVNTAFTEQTGIGIEQAIGKTATELDLWGTPGIGPSLLLRLQENSVRNLEMPFRRADGSLFTGLISASSFVLDNTPALVVVVRDISQLKSTQQQLQISEEKFAKAFHASPDGLLITRLRDGLLVEANEGFSHITGYSFDEIGNRPAATANFRLWNFHILAPGALLHQFRLWWRCSFDINGRRGRGLFGGLPDGRCGLLLLLGHGQPVPHLPMR